MATVESVRLSGASPAGSLTGGASEYTRATEIEAELQERFTRSADGRLDSWKEIAAYFAAPSDAYSAGNDLKLCLCIATYIAGRQVFMHTVLSLMHGGTQAAPSLTDS